MPVAATFLDSRVSDTHSPVRPPDSPDDQEDRHLRMLYATDASMYQVEPLAVRVPRSVDELERIAIDCFARALPVVVRAGGTSLVGQSINRAVVIDCSAHCDRLLDIDESRRSCVVEPGITLAELNALLHDRTNGRFFFAPDPASGAQACIGGMIATNAAGARSVRYGRTSEHLLAVDALLTAAGRVRFCRGSSDPEARRIAREITRIVRAHESLIRQRFPRTPRRNAGYALDDILSQLDDLAHLPDDDTRSARLDLCPLLAGSEGTLAITLRATLRLTPAPVARTLAVLSYTDIDEAIARVPALLELRPSAIELLDDTVLRLARVNLRTRPMAEHLGAADPSVGALLLVELQADDDPAEIDLAGLGEAGATSRIRVLDDQRQVADAWALRKAGEPLLHAVAGPRKPVSFVEDCAIPVERLSAFVRTCRAIVEEAGTTAAFWAHASVGVLHVRPLVDPRNAHDRAAMVEMAQRICDCARALGGVVSGEHGDGRARSPLLPRYFGPELMRAFRQVREVFDPHGLLNPGNITDPGEPASIVTRLRVLPRHGTVPVTSSVVRTRFDFGAEGFLAAAEACNGAGFCRRRFDGTMCPTYRATREERHSTRGRANALRLALSGQLPHVLDDPQTLGTLDLCLGCKACKRECPSNVDLARLKSEYLYQSFRVRGGAPLRSRIMGYIPEALRIAGAVPRLSNSLACARSVRILLERLLGLDRRRSLPTLTPSLKRRWGGNPTSGPRVVLLSDAFTTHTEPWIALAARRVLEAAGQRVQLVCEGDFARAQISLGLLDDAWATIDRTITRLRPLVDDPDVRALCLLEPSCFSAIHDDWQALRMCTPMPIRSRFRDRVMLIEQFLTTLIEDGLWQPEVRSVGGRILVHEHCHQQALLGDGSSERLLRRFFGDRVVLLDSGCCGMAGAFGYVHYDLSLQVAEQALLPALRGRGENDIVCASGTSCRHQIRDTLGIRAQHPVEIIARLLDESFAAG